MKVWEFRNEQGELGSFEIPNIGRSRLCRFVRKTFGCTVTRNRRDDEFAEFRLSARNFVAWEAWGDSSRYLIHEKPGAQPSPELETLKAAFETMRRFYLF